MSRTLSFVIGAAAGAVAALMLSPNTGERNRELVAEKVDYYSSHGDELFQRASDTVRDKVREAGATPKPTPDEIRAKINEARDRIAEQVTRNRAAQDVEADVADIADAADELVDDIKEAAGQAVEDIADNASAE